MPEVRGALDGRRLLQARAILHDCGNGRLERIAAIHLRRYSMLLTVGDSMKRGQLRSIAHSLADSIAGGISLMTGFYELDLYGDAAKSPDGKLSVDLLNGRVIEGTPSAELSTAISSLSLHFDRLCQTASIARGDCRAANAYFYATPTRTGFTLTIEDGAGRVTETDYEGTPAHRVLERDPRGNTRRIAIRQI